MIYFDNAATSGKKPTSVIAAVNNALMNYSANPGRSGHFAACKADFALYSARKTVAEFFGSSGPETVAFTSGCTESLNFVIKGVLSGGDHIVVSDLEHNAVMRPLFAAGINYSVASVSLTDDKETVESFRKLIRPTTKMIICTGASNVIGKILPIERLGKLCKEKNILFTVDAAQIAGILPIDMKKYGIDFLCAAPHKGLYAPMGVGLLIAEKPIERTIIEGGTGIDSLNGYQEPIFPEGFESGTVNLPGILGLVAGVNYVKREGVKKIRKYESALLRRLYNGLKQTKDVVVYADIKDFDEYTSVLSFNVEGYDSSQVSDFLSKRGIAVRSGFQCSPLAHKKLGTTEFGTVRASIGAFNTSAEVDALLYSVKKLKNL